MESVLAAIRDTELPLMMEPPHLRTCAELLARAGRTLESEVHGSSMGATIPDGSKIHIHWRDERDFRPGQIVACLEHGLLFAHRVVHVRGDAIITQGDGWIFCDPPLHASQVIGEVLSCCESCGEQGAWHPPAAEAVRSPSEAHAARRQVRILAMCLAIDFGFARFVARQIIRLNIFRKQCRQLLASSGERHK